MPLIAEKANLQEAFLRAAKGKSGKCEVVAFRNHLDKNLNDMRYQLLDGSFCFGNYHFFTIYDPKKRIICAASFPERVAFHAIMRICHPVFDDYQIYDSYASRIGKGQYKAIDRAKMFCRRYKWFVKLDICKYFDSINHEIMLSQLCRLIKDSQLLCYFQHLLDSYEVSSGRGLPIGNLTSQYFANHYLSPADHYAKEQLHAPAMIRYMDDVLFFENDKDRLLHIINEYSSYVTNRLKLQLHQPVINKTCYGVPFLGYVIYANRLRLNQRSRRRFCMKISMVNKAFMNGEITERMAADRATCLFAFINKAECFHFKQKQYDMGRYS